MLDNNSQQSNTVIEKQLIIQDSNLFKIILDDLQNWQSCDHPNIAKLQSFKHDKETISYVTENSTQTLFDIIQERKINNSYFTKEEYLINCLQLLSAFSYLQKKNISHKNLNLHSILVTPPGILKLTDFANPLLSQQMKNASYNISPELRGGQNDADFLKSDIWRLGILFFELAKLCEFEESPAQNISDVPIDIVEKYDKKVIKTLVQMIHDDPQKRYSIKKVFDDFRKYAKQLNINEEKYLIKVTLSPEEEKKTTEKKQKAAPKQHTYTLMPVSEIQSHYNDNGKFSDDGKISRDQIKISTWNLNSLLHILKCKDENEQDNYFLKYMKAESPDILCLTETHLKYEDLNLETIKNNIPSEYFSFHNCHKGNIGRSGVSILTKEKPLNVIYDIGVPELDEEGRVITLEYDKFYVICCYTPNSGRQLQRLEYRTTKWDPEFKQFMKNLAVKKHVILCGDLNVAHHPIDVHNHKRYAGFTVEERDQFTLLLKEGFVDAFRSLYPQSIEYTFFSSHFDAREEHKGWRLDYFVLNPEIIKAVDEIKIQKKYLGSDHCPMEMILDQTKI